MFAKGGAAYVNQSGKVTSPIGNASGKDSKFAPEAALGIGYVVTPKVELDLTAASIFIEENSNHAVASQTVMLGVTYNIG